MGGGTYLVLSPQLPNLFVETPSGSSVLPWLHVHTSHIRMCPFTSNLSEILLFPSYHFYKHSTWLTHLPSLSFLTWSIEDYAVKILFCRSGSANFSCKRSGSKHLQPRRPHGLCHSFSALALWCDIVHRWRLSRAVLQKPSFTETVDGSFCG